MSVADETVTIEVSAKSALVKHIEELNVVIQRRNAQIERLKAQLKLDGEAEVLQKARQDGYKRGWKDACDRTMNHAGDAERALKSLRSAAFDTRLKIEGAAS